MKMKARRLRLEVDEHSSLRGVAIDVADAEALRASRARLLLEARPGGRYDIRTKQMVGTVRTANVDLVIRPKVEVGGFLELLSHAPALARLGGHLHLRRWDELLPALTGLYARSLRDALRRGVPVPVPVAH